MSKKKKTRTAAVRGKLTSTRKAAYNRGRREGYKRGKAAGYKAGYKTGKLEGNKTGYDRGLLDGTQHRHQLIKAMQITNNKLWDELVRLDREEPLIGVLVSFDFAEQLVKCVRSEAHNYRLATRLRGAVKEARRTATLPRIIEKMQEEAEE